MKNAPARLLSEFLGVFFLCLVALGAVTNSAGLTGAAIANGFVVFAGICAFGHTSGAHFNPAVTTALALTKRISVVDALGYVAAQILGGIAAAGIWQLMTDAWQGAPQLASGVSMSQGLIAEIIATFMMMIVIMGVAVDKRGSFAIIAGLPIGLAITSLIFFAGPISGAAMNPARWFGPALINGDLSNALVWILGPIVGAIAAAVVYDRIMKPARD
jgi:MIP family channel proteins